MSRTDVCPNPASLTSSRYGVAEGRHINTLDEDGLTLMNICEGCGSPLDEARSKLSNKWLTYKHRAVEPYFIIEEEGP